MKKVLSLFAVPLALIVVFGLFGCSAGGTKYYQLNKLMTLDGESIIRELEENQGLTYDSASGTAMYYWSGNPKDTFIDGVSNVNISLLKDSMFGAYLTKDEILSGEEEIAECSFFFIPASSIEGSEISLSDAICSKCGFTEVSGEGENALGTWMRVGTCKVGEKDAYWTITMYEDVVDVRVAIDTSGNEAQELAEQLS